MRAINPPVPGLPTSYLTNSRGFDVEGKRHSSPLPVYHTADGKLTVMRWKFSAIERFRLLLPKSGVEYVQLKGEAFTTPFCVQKKGPTPGAYVLPYATLTFSEWLRFLATGDMWHVLKNVDGQFVTIRLSGKIPVSVEDEILEREKHLRTNVMMAAKDMVPGDGHGIMGEIIRANGTYTIEHYPAAGQFDTENEALAWLSGRLRETFKRQWSSAKDALSYSGYPEYPTLRCPKCEVALTGSIFDGERRWVCLYACPKCHEKYQVTNGEIKPVNADFVLMATSAGFTPEQVDFLWNLVNKK